MPSSSRKNALLEAVSAKEVITPFLHIPPTPQKKKKKKQETKTTQTVLISHISIPPISSSKSTHLLFYVKV